MKLSKVSKEEKEGVNSEIGIRLDHETGRLERLEDELFSNLRVMVIDEQFYKGLRDKLYERFQSGASVILYDMGMGYGELMGKTIRSVGVSKLGSYKKFIELGKRQGYGQFDVPLLKMIISGIRGEPLVILKDSFFATSVGRTGQAECYIIAGMIAGAARLILGKNFGCREEMCISKGEIHCQFRLKEVRLAKEKEDVKEIDGFLIDK